MDPGKRITLLKSDLLLISCRPSMHTPSFDIPRILCQHTACGVIAPSGVFTRAVSRSTGSRLQRLSLSLVVSTYSLSPFRHGHSVTRNGASGLAAAAAAFASRHALMAARQTKGNKPDCRPCRTIGCESVRFSPCAVLDALWGRSPDESLARFAGSLT